MNRSSFGLSVMIVASMLTGCHDDDLLSSPDISPPGWLDVRLTGAPGRPGSPPVDFCDPHERSRCPLGILYLWV